MKTVPDNFAKYDAKITSIRCCRNWTLSVKRGAMFYTTKFLGEKATIDQIKDWFEIRFSYEPKFLTRVSTVSSLESAKRLVRLEFQFLAMSRKIRQPFRLKWQKGWWAGQHDKNKIKSLWRDSLSRRLQRRQDTWEWNLYLDNVAEIFILVLRGWQPLLKNTR